jgi:hypothetical protein
VSGATPEGAAGTPSAEETPRATEQVKATSVGREGLGTVSGSIDNNTGEDLPSDLKVTLRGYDHGADPSTGPQEVLTLESTLEADGTFVFENVEMPLSRIFLAELTYEGLALQSDFAIVEEGATSLSLPPIPLYARSEDTSALVIDETRVFFEYGTDVVQVFNVYSFRNPGDETILIDFGSSNEIPFIRSPEGSTGFGYEPLQDSEPFQPVENGFAIPPSENAYGLIAFASLPKAKEVQFTQEFVLPVSAVTVFLPEGVRAEGAEMTDLGVQTIQNFNFQIYELTNVEAGQTVAFTISGTPRASTNAASPDAASDSNTNLLLGAGAVGLALIMAGGWLYLRDRRGMEENDVEEVDEFESSEEVIDAIIALDDLHRAKKISADAYQKRRAQLKEILKEML